VAVKYDSGNRAGNEADSVNRGDASYNEKFNKLRQGLSDVEAKGDQILREEGKSSKPGMHIDTHGDEVYDNPESDNVNLGEQEKSGGGSGNQTDDLFNPGTKLESNKNALQRLFAKNGAKPTAGVGAAMTFLFVVLTSIGGGASLGAALEKGLTNENANDTRTNLVMYRAFGNMLGHVDCKGGKLICKMKTAAKEQVQKFKDGKFTVRGIVTDENGKSKGGGEKVINPDDIKDGERVAIASLDPNDGTKPITTPGEFQNRLSAEPNLRAKLTNAFNMRTGDFLHTKFNKLLGKFGVNKAKATAEEKKIQENKASIDSEKEKALENSKPDSTGNIPKTITKILAGGPIGTVASRVSDACLLYNVTRIAVGAVKAKWVTDLIRFGWPFMRLVSKMIDGSVTDADIAEVEARFGQLTAYLSPAAASELEEKIRTDTLTDADQTTLRDYGIPELNGGAFDGITNLGEVTKQDQIEMLEDIKGKTATDSQGLRAALYGDDTALEEITKAYSTAAIGSLALANSAISIIQSGLGGKRNVRLICIAANTISIDVAGAQVVQCFLGGVNWAAGLKCLGQIAYGAGKYIVAYQAIRTSLELLVPVLLASVSLSSNLKGPAAGAALSAMMGLLLTRKSQSSALKPAMTLGAINQFLTTTNETYNQYGDQLAYYEAKSTPLDTSNRYSFMGQIVNSLNPNTDPSNQKTGFSYISNIMAVIGNTLNPAANALHSSPVLLTQNEEYLKKQVPINDDGTSACPDFEKQNEGFLCNRMSGQTINITSPRILQWANEDATGKSDHLSEVITYMQKPQPADEKDGGTHDESCSEISNIAAGEFFGIGDCKASGDLASIDEDGKEIPDSQFDKYIKYCTGERAMEMGSSDIDADTGSRKEQDWHSGLQCGGGIGQSAGGSSYMMDAFAYYYNMCYTQYAVANGETDCTSGAAATPAAGNGDVCSLLNNPHIHYEQKATEEDLKKLCAGESVKSYCGQDIKINPALITALTSNASKYDVTINNFGFVDDRHVSNDCQPGKQHWKGNGVDISKIARIGSATGAGNGSYGSVQFGGQNGVLIGDYASDFLATLPNNRGGVGQKGCSSTFNPRFPPGSVALNGAHFFADACNHLHIDVRDRTNVNAI
jgi:hypothetical protein